MQDYRRWLLLGTLIAAPAAATVLAPTIVTDELASPGAGCSLREAVLQANSNALVDAACGPAGEDAATDTITLAPGATYSLTLAGSEDLSVAGDLDFADNAAAVDLAVVGSDSTIANASSPKDRVLHVLADANVTVSGVTIREGLVVGAPAPPVGMGGFGEGGGILNLGSLALSDCIVVGNRAVGGAGGPSGSGGYGRGGGIASFGPLSLDDCSVRLNLAEGGTGPSNGTGGFAQGGGVLQSGATATLARTRFEGNTALGGAWAGIGGGGGLWTNAALTATDCVFRDNLAKGGRSLGVPNSSTGSGYGGGLYLDTELQSIATTTISGNRVEVGDDAVGDDGGGSLLGGGIFNRVSVLTVTNSTISGNSALPGSGMTPLNTSRGGALFVSEGAVYLDSVTLTASVGGGIRSIGFVSMSNMIVALQASGPDCVGDGFLSADFNIDSDGTCGLTQGNDQPGVNAFALRLGPLADNGGFGETHAINPASAAYNRGATALASDQRGMARPQWGVDDIGAFEQPREVSVVDIPALSPAALALFACLLAFAARQLLRRGDQDDRR